MLILFDSFRGAILHFQIITCFSSRSAVNNSCSENCSHTYIGDVGTLTNTVYPVVKKSDASQASHQKSTLVKTDLLLLKRTLQLTFAKTRALSILGICQWRWHGWVSVFILHQQVFKSIIKAFSDILHIFFFFYTKRYFDLPQSIVFILLQFGSSHRTGGRP